jgi:hypothetical protein
VPWIAVAALAVVAWGVTVMLARTMGNGPGTMGLALLPFLGLWLVMMAAMMLRMGTFLAGYLLAWAVAGTVAFAAQLTAWKGWCLRRCRSPIGALMYYLGFKGRSRDGGHHRGEALASRQAVRPGRRRAPDSDRGAGHLVPVAASRSARLRHAGHVGPVSPS